ADEKREKYLGVIHDCRVNVGGVIRLCQVWVQNLDSDSVLLGRSWQKSVCLKVEDTPDGETWIDLLENPDGSGKRLKTLIIPDEHTTDVGEIGYQGPINERNDVKALKLFVLLPDLSLSDDHEELRLKDKPMIKENSKSSSEIDVLDYELCNSAMIVDQIRDDQ